MRIILYLVCVFTSIIIVSGCISYRSPVVPPIGAFSNIQVPVDVNFNDTVIGSKTGESQMMSIYYGYFAFGDCSIYGAAKNGNIKRIDHVEHAYTNYFGYVTIYKIKVYGE